MQPLRDPMVDDLRERAAALETQGDLAGAVAALDQALTSPAPGRQIVEVALAR